VLSTSIFRHGWKSIQKFATKAILSVLYSHEHPRQETLLSLRELNTSHLRACSENVR
jgi:hypothetical protein